MDVWTMLAGRAEEGLKAVTVTLVDAPDDQRNMIGQMAVIKDSRTEPHGPLVAAPFWAADQEAVLREAGSDRLPETGLMVECEDRRYFVSALVYQRSALVLGGGHVGDAVCRLLNFLDFEVTLMDDRPEFLQNRDDGTTTVEAPFSRLTELFAASNFEAVVIVTRGHAQDSACLRQVLAWPDLPPYLGMIGSRHRTRATLDMLSQEGVSRERLDHVHTPVGLNIDAQTPAEIAVSIAAEIIMVLAGA